MRSPSLYVGLGVSKSIYSVNQKCYTRSFRQKKFPQRLRIFNQNFACLLYVYIYVELPNFIQLYLTLMKFFTLHKTKSNHEKSWYRCNHAAVWLISATLGIGTRMQDEFSRAPAVKKFVQDGGRPMRLRDLFWIIMTWFFDFEGGGRPPSWIFKIAIFNSHSLHRHVFHHRARFCGGHSCHFRDIAFLAFLVKCKNSLDDSA